MSQVQGSISTPTISQPIVPPPQMFSNVATLITSTVPQVVGISLFRNGILQTAGFDYTRSNATITFVTAPVDGDVLTARLYSVQRTVDGATPGAGPSPLGVRYAAPVTFTTADGTITGAMDGANLVFNLVFGPTLFGTLDGVNDTFYTQVNFRRAQVWRNGQAMTQNFDCAVGVNAVKFFGAQVPQPGDFLLLAAWI